MQVIHPGELRQEAFLREPTVRHAGEKDILGHRLHLDGDLRDIPLEVGAKGQLDPVVKFLQIRLKDVIVVVFQRERQLVIHHHLEPVLCLPDRNHPIARVFIVAEIGLDRMGRLRLHLPLRRGFFLAFLFCPHHFIIIGLVQGIPVRGLQAKQPVIHRVGHNAGGGVVVRIAVGKDDDPDLVARHKRRIRGKAVKGTAVVHQHLPLVGVHLPPQAIAGELVAKTVPRFRVIDKDVRGMHLHQVGLRDERRLPHSALIELDLEPPGHVAHAGDDIAGRADRILFAVRLKEGEFPELLVPVEVRRGKVGRLLRDHRGQIAVAHAQLVKDLGLHKLLPARAGDLPYQQAGDHIHDILVLKGIAQVAGWLQVAQPVKNLAPAEI